VIYKTLAAKISVAPNHPNNPLGIARALAKLTDKELANIVIC